jgi:hypothetical protein
MSVDRIISSKAWRQLTVFLMVTLFIVSTGIPVTLSHAQNRYKPEAVLPAGYPDGFDGYGRIDDLDDYRAVIQDILIKLAPSATFHMPNNMFGTIADFEIGDRVGYMKNEQGEITSMWLIE